MVTSLPFGVPLESAVVNESLNGAVWQMRPSCGVDNVVEKSVRPRSPPQALLDRRRDFLSYDGRTL